METASNCKLQAEYTGVATHVVVTRSVTYTDTPKALNAQTYTAPNGASMRPNSPLQHIHIRKHTDGDDVVIYAIPKGTSLPDDLILVHERSDHYSLQPAKEMTLEGMTSALYSLHSLLSRSCAAMELSQFQGPDRIPEMPLELNKRMTEFMKVHGKTYTKPTWIKAYPTATEPWRK